MLTTGTWRYVPMKRKGSGSFVVNRRIVLAALQLKEFHHVNEIRPTSGLSARTECIA